MDTMPALYNDFYLLWGTFLQLLLYCNLTQLLRVAGKPCFIVPEDYTNAALSQSGVVLFGSSPVTVTCDAGYAVSGNVSLSTTQTIACRADQTFEDAEPCLGRLVCWS